MSIEESKKPLVLALSPYNQDQYFDVFAYRQDLELVISKVPDVSILEQYSPDILITLTCHTPDIINFITKARDKSIPSLLMMDGILEWRHVWENPRYGSGGGIPFNQPIYNDKVACYGWEAARTLEGWGNLGKCEIVGFPRFDHWIDNNTFHKKGKNANQPMRLLIATANNPGFTDDQRNLTKSALRDLKKILINQSVWDPIWRVTNGFDEELGLTDYFPELHTQPLSEVLPQVDAVLSMPSTVVVESMMAGLPTAIFDYSNSPNYIRTAWTITSPNHIESTLDGLFRQEVSRMIYQYESLHSILECYTPAEPRLIELVNQLIKLGRQARQKGISIKFPDRILQPEYFGYLFPSKNLDFASLYPEHPAFESKDIQELQNRLAQLHRRVSDLQTELESRSGYSWVRTVFRGLYGWYKRRLA